ncbi:MAG: hypothetical protein ACE5J5_01140 [Candidatus Hydrothermarchaeales archaeon]
MDNKKTVFLLLFLFATTQVLGVIYQAYWFEAERLNNPDFVKQESMTLSPKRETKWPLILFAIAFVFAIFIYTFLFRLNVAAKALKIFIFLVAIMSFFLISWSLGFWLYIFMIETIALQQNLILVFEALLMLSIFLATTIVALLVITGKYQTIIRPILGVTLCAMTGAAIASYFTLKTILALLFILSIYDFVFVKKTKHIPKLVTMLDKHNVLLTMDIGPKRSLDAPEEPVELVDKDDKTGTTLVGRRLGFGDLIFATGLAVATYVDKNALAAMIMVFFTTLSLGGFLDYLHRTNNTNPQPAIPPIFVGGLMGAIFAFLLF